MKHTNSSLPYFKLTQLSTQSGKF